MEYRTEILKVAVNLTSRMQNVINSLFTPVLHFSSQSMFTFLSRSQSSDCNQFILESEGRFVADGMKFLSEIP